MSSGNSSGSSSVSSPRVIGGEPTAKDLAVASRDGNLEVVKVLVAKGISCNEICEFGGTAMHQAATSGQNEVVTFFIDSQEADVEKVTAGGATALHLATEKNHDAVVSTLCAKGAKLEAVDRHLRTPLHVAAFYSSDDCLTLLCHVGANKESLDADGHTPMHLAARYGKLSTVKALKDCNVRAVSKAGLKPIDLARLNPNNKKDCILDYLVEAEIEMDDE